MRNISIFFMVRRNDELLKDTMSEIVNQSLQKIAKGTGIIFVGTIIGMLLGFVGRVLLARFFTQAEYGIYSLALVLLNIFMTISLFGLQDGAARQIGYYRGKNDSLKVKGIIFSSIQIVLIASIILSILLFFASDILSTKIFHDPALAAPLKVLAFAIPFLALTQLFVSFFRGFESVKENVYFQNILRNVLFPAFLIPVVILGLPFIDAIYAFAASIIITFVAFAFYVSKKIPLSLRDCKSNLVATNPVGKELFFFSIPLLGSYMLSQIMTQTDTLMLGYFTTSDVVGLYNAAVPLARIIVTFLYSTHFMFIPITAKLYSQNLTPELKRNYQILSKWVLFAVLPLFFVFMFFPEVILSSFFGVNYVKASLALQILSVCFFIHVLMGPSGAAIISMGRTKFDLFVCSIGTALNLLLNATLIPIWGINGAAIATAFSLLTMHGLYSIKLYQISRIHPFTKSYLTPFLTSSLIISLIYFVAKSFVTINTWTLLLLFVSFIATCIAVLILSKSIEEEDIMLLLTIERRSGLNLVKNILKRFV